MQHARFKKQHAYAQGSLQAFKRPSSFKIVVVLLLVVSCVLMGTGIIALLLAPFAIFMGAFLFLFTLSLAALLVLARGCVSFVTLLIERLGRTRTFMYLAPAIHLRQVLLVRLLVRWLEDWLKHHEPHAYEKDQAAAASHYQRTYPLLSRV